MSDMNWPSTRRPLGALLAAIVLLCGGPSWAGGDQGNLPNYRLSCYSGALSTIYHGRLIINRSSTAYLLHGESYVRKFCEPIIHQYDISPTWH